MEWGLELESNLDSGLESELLGLTELQEEEEGRAGVGGAKARSGAGGVGLEGWGIAGLGLKLGRLKGDLGLDLDLWDLESFQVGSGACLPEYISKVATLGPAHVKRLPPAPHRECESGRR